MLQRGLRWEHLWSITCTVPTQWHQQVFTRQGGRSDASKTVWWGENRDTAWLCWWLLLMVQKSGEAVEVGSLSYFWQGFIDTSQMVAFRISSTVWLKKYPPKKKTNIYQFWKRPNPCNMFKRWCQKVVFIGAGKPLKTVQFFFFRLNLILHSCRVWRLGCCCSPITLPETNITSDIGQGP